MTNILSLLILLPLVGALFTFSAGRFAKPAALAFSLGIFALAAHLGLQFDPTASGYTFTENLPWLPAYGISYALGIDGISLPLIVLTALLIPLCLLASWKIERNAPAFFAAFLALESFVIGVFAALDLILFYVFWEAMLIPMFLIIGIWGGENRVYAALKFFLYTFLGSVLMLVAILWLGTHFGTFNIPELTTKLSAAGLPLLTQQLLWFAFFTAFAVKVPMWPVHTWLPDAHVQAPTAGSVILAGVLLKLGAYGFLRFSMPFFPEASAWFTPFVFTLSAVAVVYAALAAYAQTDIKKLIAYSSVSHMGLVTLGIFAGTEEGLHGALLIMINHGIVSAGLFLAIGTIYERTHTRDLAKYGGLVQVMPQYAWVVMLLTLAAVALPGTNGFVGEFLGLAGSWPTAPVYTAIATTGVIFGALYMLWLYRKMIFGKPSQYVDAHRADLPDLTCREWAYFLPLLILIPILGIQPNYAMDLWRQPVTQLSSTYLPVLQKFQQPVAPVAVEAPATPEAIAPAEQGTSTTVAISETAIFETIVSTTSPTEGH